MKTLSILLVALLVALAGCGDDDSDTSKAAPRGDAATHPPPDPAAAPEAKDDAPAARKGTKITLGDSEFGEMLFDTKKQAIYIFEKDPKGETVCYGECAEAWPPVYTDG